METILIRLVGTGTGSNCNSDKWEGQAERVRTNEHRSRIVYAVRYDFPLPPQISKTLAEAVEHLYLRYQTASDDTRSVHSVTHNSVQSSSRKKIRGLPVQSLESHQCFHVIPVLIGIPEIYH